MFPYNVPIVESFRTGLDFGHKLRDSQKFRPAAKHFEEFGVYTKFQKSLDKNSPYYKYWQEEKRRSLEGYHIGGDWITGYHYWYLNYCPIWQVVMTPEDEERKRNGERVTGKKILEFPEVWDYDYYYFHYLEEAESRGEHGSVLKSRRRGYSYKGGSMATRNFFLIKGSKTFVMAGEEGFLTGKDSILDKAWDMKEFINKHTGFMKHSQKHNTKMHMKASKIVKETGRPDREEGYMSEIIGITLKNNPDSARGISGKLILWEEAGEFPNLMKGWQIAQESVEQDGVAYGLMVAFGTGGSKMTAFRTLNELFNKPGAYNIHSITNIWSKRPTNRKCGFFVPSYSNAKGFMDKDGNSQLEDAYNSEEAVIEKMEMEGAESSTILQKRAERPKHPEEALLRKDGNEFPVQRLKDRLGDIEADGVIRGARWVGRMRISKEGKPEFVYDAKCIPIDRFPHTSEDKRAGAVVIYEHPIKDNNGEPRRFMYIGGIDPYDQDNSTTTSLGGCYIMDRTTKFIVASYIGRPATAKEYDEQVRLLLLYYGATANFENNLLGLKKNFESANCLYLLARDLQAFRKVTKVTKIEREYGTPGTTGVNKYCRELIKAWLLTKIDSDSEKTYLDTIEDTALLQELIEWNVDDNFDRVSALGMLVIYLEELLGIQVERPKERRGKKKGDEWDEIMGFVDEDELDIIENNDDYDFK